MKVKCDICKEEYDKGFFCEYCSGLREFDYSTKRPDGSGSVGVIILFVCICLNCCVCSIEDTAVRY